MSRSFRILVNPAAGGGKAMERVKPVAAILRDTGADVQVVVSLGVDHSVEEVAVAAEAGQLVVACGGDGMLASVAAAVVERDVPLGIIPSGRGNDFARMLRLLDANPEKIAHALLEGDPTPVDVIRVGDMAGSASRGLGPHSRSESPCPPRPETRSAREGMVVLGSVYAGVDSLASELVNRATWLPGSLQYPYAAVRALLTYQPTRYTVTVDGSSVVVEAYSIVVANSSYYGKGMKVAPAAAVDDGMLDVVVIPKASRLKLIRLMPKIYDGSHVELDEVLTFRGSSVRVSARDHVTAYGDGEPLCDLPLTAEVGAGKLQVLLP